MNRREHPCAGFKNTGYPCSRAGGRPDGKGNWFCFWHHPEEIARAQAKAEATFHRGRYREQLRAARQTKAWMEILELTLDDTIAYLERMSTPGVNDHGSEQSLRRARPTDGPAVVREP